MFRITAPDATVGVQDVDREAVGDEGERRVQPGSPDRREDHRGAGAFLEAGAVVVDGHRHVLHGPTWRRSGVEVTREFASDDVPG
jgi:hypothetical protein